MKFKIDPGAPEVETKVDGIASDLSEAVESCFPMDTEHAILTLSGIKIPIEYKYDLSVIIDDIIDLLEHCLKSDNFEIHFGSNTFTSSWFLDFLDDNIRFYNFWDPASGYDEVKLNRAEKTIVPKEYFLSQWINLVRVGVDGVKEAGIEIDDRDMLRRAENFINS